MKRTSLIGVLGVLLAAGSFGGLYISLTAACRELEKTCGPELAWIKKEFQLSDADLERVRTLHEAYKPVCADYCRKIDDKNKQVAALLMTSANVTPEIQKALTEAGQLRAQCYVEMLNHFFQVSQAMPPDQGRRCLACMQSATLAPTHQSMLPQVDSPAHDLNAHGH